MTLNFIDKRITANKMAAPLHDNGVNKDRDTKSALVTLDNLPTELLLKVIGFLPFNDILSLTNLGFGCRLGRIAADPSLFRTLHLSRCYHLTRHTLEVLLLKWRNTIQYLDISNCYWLTPEDLSSLDFRLPNLIHLDIRNMDLPFNALHQILKHSHSLRSLSYNQNGGIKCCDISQSALQTLSHLQELNVVYISQKCVRTNEKSFMEYCPKLTAFSINASYMEDMDVECSCGRSVNDVISFKNLKHFLIGRRAHNVHNKSLNFDIVEYSPNQCTVLFTDGCFSPTNDMKNAGYTTESNMTSLTMICVPDLKLPPFRGLTYLNIAGSVDFTDLSAVAENCRYLERLNVSFCMDALKTVNNSEKWTDLSAFRVFVEARTPLKHLNISGMHPHLPDNELCEVLAQLPGLVSVSLPVCGLPERKYTYQVPLTLEDRTFSQTRSRTNSSGSVDFKCSQCSRNEQYGFSITTETMKTDSCACCTSDLFKLVISCNKMQSFELIKTGFISFFCPRTAPVDEDVIQCGDVMDPEGSLLCISHWKYLQSLVLAGIPSILHGYSLVAITQGCPMLTTLSLAHLGPYPYDQCFFMKNLCEAMKYAKHLQDFRFEQPKVIQLQSLLHSLKCCLRLRRVCLITQTGRIKELDELTDVMDQCSDLMVLQVICSVYFGTCTKWQQALMDKYQVNRPALHVVIANYKKCAATRLRDVCSKVPFIHLDELTLFQTRVATNPPPWNQGE